ncbi:hypothetical protein HMPREF1550_01298 [Actinomyces sp. oral taxon 877 str. F0543]|nr:hypothetical protein HMPREF1550_01298 [Actinomyces sp. oral taxon 877 str. F0543]
MRVVDCASGTGRNDGSPDDGPGPRADHHLHMHHLDIARTT